MGYVEEAFAFNAAGSAATLGFLSADNPSSESGPVLDNVAAMLATPEPGPFGLILLGLGFAGAATARRAIRYWRE